MSDSVCTVIVNFQTPDLLCTAIESFRQYYPQLSILIVDNGSRDSSREVILKLQNAAPRQTRLLFLKKNIYHGPAMHRALQEVGERYVFFLDSDTETQRGGFIEELAHIYDASDHIYGVGQILTVNKRGFPAQSGIHVLAPAYMMIRREVYYQLPPFVHHGMPVLNNFIDAQKRNYILVNYPIENYIKHRWRGTASRFGYGLGWRGRVDFVLNKLGR